MKIRKLLGVVSILFMLCLSVPASATENLCDRYAANPADKAKVSSGVRWNEMNVKLALKHCARAVKQAPDNPRYNYQYGRALQKAGEAAEALRYYKKADALGHAMASHNIGSMFREGKILEKDEAESVKWFRKAAEQGVRSSQYYMGEAYYFGKGVDKDYNQALKWFRMAAERGDDDAQYYIGEAYYFGKGVDKDYKQAFKWFQMSAEQGDDDAQYYMGEAYYFGRGVGKDYKHALKWFRKSAEQGDSDSQYMLGMMYNNGRGVVEDEKQAAHWYRKAAEQGHSSALYVYGVLASQGTFPEKYEGEGGEWVYKAASQGYTKAIQRLKQGAENEYDSNMYYYGRLLEEGNVVDKDVRAAMALYDKVHGTFYPDVKLHLARIYHKGNQVTKDEFVAMKHLYGAYQTCVTAEKKRRICKEVESWFNGAVSRKEPEAMFFAAEYVSWGVYDKVKNNPMLKRKLSRKYLHFMEGAANKGLLQAQWELVNTYLKGSILVDPDPAKAGKWLRAAAENGHMDAQYELGMKYIRGLGVAVNPAKALKWFSRAHSQNHPKVSTDLLSIVSGIQENYAAARDGDDEAALILARLYNKEYEVKRGFGRFGKTHRLSVAQAERWYRKAVKSGDVDIQYELGRFYWQFNEDGVGTEVAKALMRERTRGATKAFSGSLDKAKYWLQRAADQGHVDARELLQQIREREKKAKKYRRRFMQDIMPQHD